MNIRSVTCFFTVGDPEKPLVDSVGRWAGEARVALEAAGFSVQTTRLATQPLSDVPASPLTVVSPLWDRAAEAGFEYLSLGPVVAASPEADLTRIEDIAELICSTESVFASVLVGHRRSPHGRPGLHLEAIRRTAALVREIADTTALGFGNLRLGMLANVGPHAPFFPAAYHDGGEPALALATESADLFLAALDSARSLDEAQESVVRRVEEAAGRMVRSLRPLLEGHGVRFVGIDFSPAPFPDEARSIAAAMERLGVDRFGAPGCVFVAAFLTGCLRQARYPRCGFNGLMLPVLEDMTLADRSREGLFTVNDLLLYSAVCGTGLDTVPLPGTVSEEELAGILLDVATMAVRLDKPLTARLMPIPGARAGDVTQFDFPYFANGRVLAVKGLGSRRLFERGAWFDLS